MPTYKIKHDKFQSIQSEKRKPAYVDRILFKSRLNKDKVKQGKYFSLEECKSSDHYPIYTQYFIKFESK